MVVLDTDHVSLVNRPDSSIGVRLLSRLEHVPADEVVTSIVTYEEQLRGWLSYLATAKTVSDQIDRYRRLGDNLAFFCRTTLLPFNAAAAVEFQRLRTLRLGVGTMDLKIASITIANEGILLTRNLADFRDVPGLAVEDWST